MRHELFRCATTADLGKYNYSKIYPNRFTHRRLFIGKEALTWASRKVAGLVGDDVAVVLDRRGHVAGDGLKLFARALKFQSCSGEKQIKLVRLCDFQVRHLHQGHEETQLDPLPRP